MPSDNLDRHFTWFGSFKNPFHVSRHERHGIENARSVGDQAADIRYCSAADKHCRHTIRYRKFRDPLAVGEYDGHFKHHEGLSACCLHCSKRALDIRTRTLDLEHERLQTDLSPGHGVCPTYWVPAGL